mmetsp:Transcript_86819/g.193282  ORF Transcript_86819/g.193282 Transcript_86819/m.193282 type:complete len:272 (+) Transcript_86819:468-1283(+)
MQGLICSDEEDTAFGLDLRRPKDREVEGLQRLRGYPQIQRPLLEIRRELRQLCLKACFQDLEDAPLVACLQVALRAAQPLQELPIGWNSLRALLQLAKHRVRDYEDDAVVLLHLAHPGGQPPFAWRGALHVPLLAKVQEALEGEQAVLPAHHSVHGAGIQEDVHRHLVRRALGLLMTSTSFPGSWLLRPGILQEPRRRLCCRRCPALRGAPLAGALRLRGAPLAPLAGAPVASAPLSAAACWPSPVDRLVLVGDMHADHRDIFLRVPTIAR